MKQRIVVKSIVGSSVEVVHPHRRDVHLLPVWDGVVLDWAMSNPDNEIAMRILNMVARELA